MGKTSVILQRVRKTTISIFLTSLIWSLVSCVSVSLESKAIKRKSDVRFDPPAAPFEKMSAAQVDEAWKNKKTGGIISFMSDCSNDSDPSLESLRREVLQGLHEEKLLNESLITYLGRAAQRSSLSGQVDGIPSSLELLIFKKDGCSYILNLVSTPKTLAQDRPYFENFLTRFNVP